MLKKLFAAFAAIIVTGSLAFAAGMFQGFPILSGPSYCNTTVNGVCQQTIPGAAGNLSTYVPADTRLSGGRNPQTVLIPGSTFGAGVQNEVPLTGASITLAPNISKLFLNPAGTIAAATITLPASTDLFDGQVFYLASSQIVTALTLTAGSGTTLGTTTTALAVNTPIRYVYMAATKVWIKG